MKNGIMRMRKSIPLTLLALILSIALTSVGTTSPIPLIVQASPTTMIFLDQPTIDGTAIGEEFNVSIMIRDGYKIYGWQAGLTFNPDLLECIDLFEGGFLSNEAPPENILFGVGTINNTVGMIWPPYYCIFLGDWWASGNGKLAYATFKVKAPGVSDIHLSSIKLLEYPPEPGLPPKPIPVNIIDVYTAILDTTAHTVVTVSNSTNYMTSIQTPPGSGFSGHSFNLTLKEVSFKVAGTSPGFSNVTIPKALLAPPVAPRVWAVVINGTARMVEPTWNDTHTFVYFTYPAGVNEIQVTTRFMPSTITIALSPDSIPLGETVTISGSVTGADDEARKNVTVTIQNRTGAEAEWDILATVKTDENGEYTYKEWKPGTAGTHEVKASWAGDIETLPAESEVLTLTVTGAGGIPIWVWVVVVVVIIVVVAIVVYFVKFRKPKPE